VPSPPATRAERHGSAEQLVNEAVFRAADRHAVEPGQRQEPLGIMMAAVRRVEDERNALLGALANFEGRHRREIVGRRHGHKLDDNMA
jgi:hypothetical protein